MRSSTITMYTKTVKNKPYTLPETLTEENQYRKDIGQYKQWACPMNCLFVWPTKLGDVYNMGSVTTWLEGIPNTKYLLRVFSVDTQPGNVYAAIDPLYSGMQTNKRNNSNEPVVISIAETDSLDEPIRAYIEKLGLRLKFDQNKSGFIPLFRADRTTLNNHVLNWSRFGGNRASYQKTILIRNDKPTWEAYTILDKEVRKARLLWTQNIKDIKIKDLQEQADERGMSVEDLIKNKLTKKDIKLSSERTLMLLEFSSVFSKTRMEIERFEAMLADVDQPMKVKDCRALRQSFNNAKNPLYRIQHHKTTKL